MEGQAVRLQPKFLGVQHMFHFLAGLDAEFTLQRPMAAVVIHRHPPDYLGAGRKFGKLFQLDMGIERETAQPVFIGSGDIARELGGGTEHHATG